MGLSWRSQTQEIKPNHVINIYNFFDARIWSVTDQDFSDVVGGGGGTTDPEQGATGYFLVICYKNRMENETKV